MNLSKKQIINNQVELVPINSLIMKIGISTLNNLVDPIKLKVVFSEFEIFLKSINKNLIDLLNNYMTIVDRSYSYAIENEKIDLTWLLADSYTYSSVIATNQGSYKIINYSNLINDIDQISIESLAKIQNFVSPSLKGLRNESDMGNFIIKDRINGTNAWLEIPPQEPVIIKKLLDELIVFINSDDKLHPLVKIALVHLRFEIIHPFKEGNGRTGRALIELMFKKYFNNTYPINWINEALNTFQKQYFQSLAVCSVEIESEESVIQFIKFFINCFNSGFNLVENKFNKILLANFEIEKALNKDYIDGTFKINKNSLNCLIKFLSENFIFDITSLIIKTKCSIRTANNVIKFLKEKEIILAPITKSKNKKIYIVAKHLNTLIKQ